MRDYYAEYVGEKNGNTSGSRVSKVSKGDEEGKSNAFDTFDTEQSDVNQKKFSLEELLENSEMREQFEFEIEERTAVLVYESGMPETEAIVAARENVKQVWFGLFKEDCCFNADKNVGKITKEQHCSNCNLEMDLIEDGNLWFCPFGCESRKAE